jgi:hypothetical protein
MDDRAADLDASFARLKLSLAGNDSDFEDALAELNAKARLANELGALRVAEPPLDQLSALPDDLLVRLLATAPPEAIAALAPVAKRYANVCERAGWACAARRFGRRTTAPFGGGAHWIDLAWVPRDVTRRPFDEGAFDATGAPPPADIADAFFWAELFYSDSSRNECLALQAVPRDGRVMRDPDGVLDDRAVGPELVLTGSVEGKEQAWHMATSGDVRIMGTLRSRVVVLYAWARPSTVFAQGEGRWPERWDAENWDEAIAGNQAAFRTEVWSPAPHDIKLSATYGMDVPSPHAADALFSVRVQMREWGGVGHLTIRLKVPMQIWGHIRSWTRRD